jgi:hypothetical protein
MKHTIYILLLFSIPALSQVNIDRDLGDFSKVAVYDGINLELVKTQALWLSKTRMEI